MALSLGPISEWNVVRDDQKRTIEIYLATPQRTQEGRQGFHPAFERSELALAPTGLVRSQGLFWLIRQTRFSGLIASPSQPASRSRHRTQRTRRTGYRCDAREWPNQRQVPARVEKSGEGVSETPPPLCNTLTRSLSTVNVADSVTADKTSPPENQRASRDRSIALGPTAPGTGPRQRGGLETGVLSPANVAFFAAEVVDDLQLQAVGQASEQVLVL
jgi:hypothetical protein